MNNTMKFYPTEPIEKQRKALNIPMKDVAKACGVHPTSFTHYWYKKGRMPEHYAHKILQLFRDKEKNNKNDNPITIGEVVRFKPGRKLDTNYLRKWCNQRHINFTFLSRCMSGKPHTLHYYNNQRDGVIPSQYKKRLYDVMEAIDHLYWGKKVVPSEYLVAQESVNTKNNTSTHKEPQPTIYSEESPDETHRIPSFTVSKSDKWYEEYMKLKTMDKKTENHPAEDQKEHKDNSTNFKVLRRLIEASDESDAIKKVIFSILDDIEG